MLSISVLLLLNPLFSWLLNNKPPPNISVTIKIRKKISTMCCPLRKQQWHNFLKPDVILVTHLWIQGKTLQTPLEPHLTYLKLREIRKSYGDRSPGTPNFFTRSLCMLRKVTWACALWFSTHKKQQDTTIVFYMTDMHCNTGATPGRLQSGASALPSIQVLWKCHPVLLFAWKSVYKHDT